MIIYFSATGNSRFIADALGDRLGDTIVCSNNYIKKNEHGVFTSEKPWVFVFPVYLSTIARIFADFIRSSSFNGNSDAYFIATCASSAGASGNICSEICREKKLRYMGTAKVDMPQNYIALFKMTEPNECRKRISAALESADSISGDIRNGRELCLPFVSKFEYKATVLVEKMYNGPFTKTKKFRVTDACTGCGLCEKLCPLNNIAISHGKPKWIKSCTHCMACINNCPKGAIEYGKGTVGKRRYVCSKYVPRNKER